MKRPFTSPQTPNTLAVTTTYALYNGDLDPAIVDLIFQLSEGGVDVSGGPNLRTFTAPFLRNVVPPNYVLTRGELLTEVNLPALLTVGELDASGSPMLTTWRAQQLAVCAEIIILDGALTVQTVNQILADLVASGWGAASALRMNGGTNAAPTGQGLTDKATLIARGATITTN